MTSDYDPAWVIYKIIYPGRILPNKREGIESIDFYPLDKIKDMISENPKMFKEDLPKVINLLGENL
ncbi:MAG: hypothetical protein ABH867_04835 [Patescibacteria group bacterium]|nr:hypothetical protein [Patescibacteria group bacterium]